MAESWQMLALDETSYLNVIWGGAPGDGASPNREMMAFRRHLIDLLSGGPRSVSSLARELGGTRRDMEADLQHAIRSARAQGHDVHIVPARCKSCAFVFGEEKLTKPGRCPACKRTRLYEPMIRLGEPGRGD